MLKGIAPENVCRTSCCMTLIMSATLSCSSNSSTLASCRLSTVDTVLMHQSAVYITSRNQNLCSMFASFSIIGLFAIIEIHCMEVCAWAFEINQVDNYLQPVHIVN
jgi:hypothetical protein